MEHTQFTALLKAAYSALKAEDKMVDYLFCSNLQYFRSSDSTFKMEYYVKGTMKPLFDVTVNSRRSNSILYVHSVLINGNEFVDLQVNTDIRLQEELLKQFHQVCEDRGLPTNPPHKTMTYFERFLVRVLPNLPAQIGTPNVYIMRAFLTDIPTFNVSYVVENNAPNANSTHTSTDLFTITIPEATIPNEIMVDDTPISDTQSKSDEDIVRQLLILVKTKIETKLTTQSQAAWHAIQRLANVLDRLTT